MTVRANGGRTRRSSLDRRRPPQIRARITQTVGLEQREPEPTTVTSAEEITAEIRR